MKLLTVLIYVHYTFRQKEVICLPQIYIIGIHKSGTSDILSDLAADEHLRTYFLEQHDLNISGILDHSCPTQAFE